MPLKSHLLELRRRLFVAFLAIGIGSIGGWFVRADFYDFLFRPVRQPGIKTQINYGDPFSAFNQQIQLSFMVGILVTSPIWLYQFWEYITPVLTKKERRYSFGFVAVSLPLFFSGCGLAWLILPGVLDFLQGFIPDQAVNIMTSSAYFSMVTRLTLAFGIAFVLPVVLVGLNMARLLKGRAILKQWRIVVFSCFLFAAVATPTPEASSMCVLAGVMCLLFAIAIGICLLLDRRRAKRSTEPDYQSMADDQASAL